MSARAGAGTKRGRPRLEVSAFEKQLVKDIVKTRGIKETTARAYAATMRKACQAVTGQQDFDGMDWLRKKPAAKAKLLALVHSTDKDRISLANALAMALTPFLGEWGLKGLQHQLYTLSQKWSAEREAARAKAPPPPLRLTEAAVEAGLDNARKLVSAHPTSMNAAAVHVLSLYYTQIPPGRREIVTLQCVPPLSKAHGTKPRLGNFAFFRPDGSISLLFNTYKTSAVYGPLEIAVCHEALRSAMWDLMQKTMAECGFAPTARAFPLFIKSATTQEPWNAARLQKCLALLFGVGIGASQLRKRWTTRHACINLRDQLEHSRLMAHDLVTKARVYVCADGDSAGTCSSSSSDEDEEEDEDTDSDDDSEP